jgi:hypothetical protein
MIGVAAERLMEMEVGAAEHRAKLHSTDKIDKPPASECGNLARRGRPRGEVRCIGWKRRQAARSSLAGLRRPRALSLGGRRRQVHRGRFFPKKQQMQWRPRGVHLIMQLQTRGLEGTLDNDFKCWPTERRLRRTRRKWRRDSLNFFLLPSFAGRLTPLAGGQLPRRVTLHFGLRNGLQQGQRRGMIQFLMPLNAPENSRRDWNERLRMHIFRPML